MFKTVATRSALGGPVARLAVDIDGIEDTTSENALEAFIDGDYPQVLRGCLKSLIWTPSD